MKITKTKNGKWTVQIYAGMDANKKQLKKRFTADTKAEVEFLAHEFMRNRKNETKKNDMTVREAIDKYIALSPMLSPTTIHSYELIKKYAFKEIIDKDAYSFNDESMQHAINLEAKRPRLNSPSVAISAKTVKNEWGLIASALKLVCNLTFNIRLPKSTVKHKILPEPELIMRIIKDTEIELPCLLAMWLSFTLSEIRGFMCSSIKNGYIYVEQVKVTIGSYDEVKKNAKTDTRIRKQAVPDYIMNLIENLDNYKNYVETGEDSFLIQLSKEQLRHRFKRTLAANEIDITFHDLRHIFASVMLTKLQIPEKVVQDEGGWKTSHVMKSVYSNVFTDSRIEADNKRDSYFNEFT